MSGPRIAAFAYSAVGHACVKALIEAGAAPVLVVTHEDDPGETRWFPSVAELARAHGIATETAEIAQGRAVEQALQAAAPDLILSFYYRRMIPMRLLRTARLGAFNADTAKVELGLGVALTKLGELALAERRIENARASLGDGRLLKVLGTRHVPHVRLKRARPYQQCRRSHGAPIHVSGV
mgnify:CR=1 FL=1